MRETMITDDAAERVRVATADHAVTVVVPALNSQETIGATIDSLLAQSWRDFSIVVVDDGSTDPIAASVVDDPHIVHLRFPDNQGYGTVTNTALDIISSRWVIFVDSDDTVAADCLERLVMRGESDDSDIVVMDLRTVTETGGVLRSTFVDPGQVLTGADALRHFINGGAPFNQHLLFRPNHVRAEGLTYSDMGFVVRLLAGAGRVSFEARALYDYMVHSSSFTGSLRPTVWDLAAIVDEAEPTLRQVFSGEEVRTAIHRLRWMQLQWMISAAGSDRSAPALRREVYSWCGKEIRFSHIVDALRIGCRGKAMSLALARMSPALHHRLYLVRDQRKMRGLG